MIFNRKIFIVLAILFFLTKADLFAGTITGSIRYENKIYDSTGFIGTNFLPVRNADIEIEVVGVGVFSGETNSIGNYSIAVSDSGVRSVFIRVYARQDDANFKVVVKFNATNNQIYAVVSSTVSVDTSSLQTINFNIDLTNYPTSVGAFNIFDTGVWAWEFMASLETLPSPLPQMTFYWQVNSSKGTYFDPSLNAIFLVGTSGDPDEFDDDIILHEVGHFFASNFSKDDSPGGSHMVTGHYDLRLAWSEGWAHFWSCSVRNFAGTTLYPEPTTIVDNFGFGFSVFDIEGPSFPSQATMATNELAVASCLWDIVTDLAGESTIWTVLRQDIPTFTQISLEDFTKGWETRVSSTDFSATQTIFASRNIKYSADSNETNDAAASATPISGTITGLTLFKNVPNSRIADKDWFHFTASAGETATIETLNLGDGADTFLELIDIDGVTPLASNDDRSSTDVSSLIQYTFVRSGIYYAKVKAFDGPGQIAEFGYYDIKRTISNITPTITMEGGMLASNYRMISFPVRPSNTSPIANLEDDLGPYNPINWRMFTYNTVTSQYEEMNWSNVQMLPGKAFWLICRNDATIDVTGELVDTASAFDILLYPGWNMIGHPFNFPVTFADVSANGVRIGVAGENGYILENLFEYNGSYILSSYLEPGHGYWVKNITNNIVTLSIPSSWAAKPLAKSNTTTALKAGDETPPPPPGIFISANSGGDSGGGGCFIATAAYGNENVESVILLKRFRNNVIAPSPIGKVFLAIYNHIAPLPAEYIKESKIAKDIAKVCIAPFIAISTIPQELFALTAIIVIAIFGMYIFTRRVKKCLWNIN